MSSVRDRVEGILKALDGRIPFDRLACLAHTLRLARLALICRCRHRRLAGRDGDLYRSAQMFGEHGLEASANLVGIQIRPVLCNNEIDSTVGLFDDGAAFRSKYSINLSR